MSQYLLRLNQLCLQYDVQVIVKDLSFAIQKGEIWGIVGESGCGKSTLLKAIYNPRLFNITVAQGEICSNIPRSKIGFIFQDPQGTLPPLQPLKTTFRQIMKSQGLWKGKESMRFAYEVLEKLRLKDPEKLLRLYPRNLSGGMCQRVSIAIALLLQPRLLLADEPTSALDTLSQWQVAQEILNLRRENNMAIIIVTHDLQLAQKLCDHILMLKRET